jgi:hypothetical protein
MAGWKGVWRFAALFLPAALLVAFLSWSVVSHRTVSVIQGQVFDGADPVAGASVRLKGQPSSVLTDASGRFQISLTNHSETERLTVCQDGFFIAGAPVSSAPLTFNLQRLPEKDYEDYEWVEPTPDSRRQHNCGNCHDEIYREWSASGHARSAGNRRFLNLLDGTDWHGRSHVGWSLRDDHPDGVGVCNTCHAPTASFETDLRNLKGVARSGVHCDFCHKIADASTEHVGFTHGRYGYRLLRPAQGQLFFGPLDDVDRGEDAFSPLYQESRYCAACHEGTVFGVPVYSTYSEWLTSPARKEGKQCQTCHMAPSGKMTNFAPGKGGIDRDPMTLANHRFFAGSQEEMLQGCLQVQARITPRNHIMEAAIEIRADQIGHRLPTGFVDRNLLLVVEPLGKEGREVPIQQGPTLPAQSGQEWAGLPGKLYAKRLKDFAGHSPVPFWRARPEVEDSRLVPGQPDRIVFQFSPEVDRLRIRLLYRRFWPEVKQSKGWPDDSISLIDQSLAVNPQEPTRWSNH